MYKKFDRHSNTVDWQGNIISRIHDKVGKLKQWYIDHFCILDIKVEAKLSPWIKGIVRLGRDKEEWRE